MAGSSSNPSALTRLFENNKFEVEEFTRWVGLRRAGISRLLNLFQISPPSPTIAYLAYEILADYRHHPKYDVDSEHVESALHEIRLYFRPRPLQRVSK